MEQGSQADFEQECFLEGEATVQKVFPFVMLPKIAQIC